MRKARGHSTLVELDSDLAGAVGSRGSGGQQTRRRTGEGYEVGPLRLDEPAQEARGVEVGAARAADLRRHVPAARGGAVAEVHVRHLTTKQAGSADEARAARGNRASYRPGGS